MQINRHASAGRAARLAAVAALAAALTSAVALWGAPGASANHPVLVEGNCDSPVPGTTLAGPNGPFCGDFDGDGRIGTAEDTDGADRIFGTLRAALGPGTGAAAGTGANQNGRITIVTSGRFAETLYVGETINNNGQGADNPGNVTIEAAPGVSAVLDAVLQGDPAGLNNTRQTQSGIFVINITSPRVFTFRNLTVRNFAQGITITRNSRVNIDNCRFENNLAYNIQAIDDSRVVITNTQSQAAGYRVGTAGSVPGPGHGLLVRDRAQARIMNSVFSHNFAADIANTTVGGASSVQLFKVASYFNADDLLGPVTSAPDPNFATTF